MAIGEESAGYELEPVIHPPPVTPAPPHLIINVNPGALPTPDLADSDIACRNCTYNLRGLDPAGVCPECGTPIARSLQGDLLIASSSTYLAMLERGLALILLAAIASAALMALGIVLAVVAGASSMWPPPMWLNVADALVASVFAVASALGWWLFSEPDPAVSGVDRGDVARRIVRCATIAVVIGRATHLITSVAAWGWSISPALTWTISMAGGVAAIVQFFAAMLYIRWLARRFPSKALDERAGQYMWLLPLIYIVGLCLLVGPLVAWILCLILLNQVREQIKAVRLRQASVFPEPATDVA